LPASDAKGFLFGREVSRRNDNATHWCGPPEEVDLNLADHPVAELDVAVAIAFVGERRVTAFETRGDVSSDNAGG
jgi:hypothetical protein